MAANVLAFTAGRRGGKSALMWHHLARESKAAGRPILCVECQRPHAGPPRFGKCECGSYAFGVRTAPVDAQLPLALDFHGGEA